MLSPILCGSTRAVIEVPDSSEPSPTMKNAASVEKLSSTSDSHGGDFTTRVKNFFSSSPLKRRRSMSLNALNQKTSSTALVFGVPLVDLVTREGRAIPYIVQKIVEHMEEEGLDQEGIYRVSGNAKLIDNLRCRFDKVGDAEFKGLDIAAVAGLLKLFLRELPSPIIPDDLIPKFVEIQHSHPGHPSPEALDLLRETLAQLPNTNYTLLKYLMHHLARVVQHSSQNKMSPVSLSIVFGPNIFRCGSGLEGLRQQGYTNSVVCRMVQHYDTLFEPAPPSPSQDLKKGDQKRPKRPKPYTEHIQEKRQKENPSSPTSMATLNGSLEGGEEYSEVSIDEAIERSSGTFSPTSPTPLQNEDVFRESSPPTSTPLLVKSPSHPEPLFVESYDEKVDGNTFQRQYAKRMKKSKSKEKETAGNSKETTKTVEKEKESGGGIGKSKQSNEVVGKPLSEPVARQPALKHPQVSSLNPHEDPDLTMRTPSPYSWQSSGSPGTSPPTSPSLTPKTSRVVSSVIADSVKQFLFEPSSSGRTLPRQPDSLQTQGGTKSKAARTDVYGLLLPDRADSPHVKKRLRQQSAITEPDSPSDVQENGLDQSDMPGTDQTDGPGTNVVSTPLSTGIKMQQVDTELTPTTPSIKAHTSKRRSRVKIVDEKKTKVDKSDQSDQKQDQKRDHHNTESDQGDVTQHPNAEKQSQPVVIRRRDRGERDAKKLRNRKSSLHGEVGTSALMEDTDVQIVSVSQEKSGTAEEIMSRKGKVSDLVRQFDETDSGVIGGGRGGGEEGKEESTPRKRKKPGLKAFKMFESSGIIMGMAPPSRPKVPVSSETDTTAVHESADGSEDLTSATRAQLSTTLSEEDVFVSNVASMSTASTSSHRGRKVQLPTTTSDDVFVSSAHTSAVEEEEGERKDSLNELDAVERSGTLQHLTLNRPRSPHRRRPRRAISTPVASLANTATREELEHGEDFTHSTGSDVAHNRLTRVQSTPVASVTTASLAESEAEQQHLKEKPEKRMERVSPKESRKKVTVEGGHSKEKRQSSESPEAPSSTPRVPLLDLTTLAPENNSSEVRQGWGDGSTEDDRAGQPSQQATNNTATVKEMGHRIHELKAAIREFETDFVTKHGHKPSAGEKSPVRPQIEELSKLRKSFRALKGRSASEEKLSQTAPPELPSTEIRPQVSTSSVLSSSVLSTSGSSVSASSSRSSLHATLENVMRLLEERRKKEERPENIELMTAEQVMAEKHSIQKSLLLFEKKYGRPQTKEDKDTMRPLYDRYRLVKKHIASREANKSLQQDKSMTTTADTLETTTDTLPSVTLLQSGFSKSLTMEATHELDESNTKLRKPSQESRGTPTGGSHVTVTNSNMQGSGTTGDTISDKQLSEISLNDLHRQHEIAMAAKKQLRKVLRDYEHEFTTAHGRAVTREDRKPMQKEYGEYRNIKGRLKLIETLISKNDPAKTL